MDGELNQNAVKGPEGLIGLRIRDVRVQRGLTQEDLARVMGISTSHVCNIESGRKNPSIEMLVSLSMLLDINLDYLVLGRDHMERPVDQRIIFRSDWELSTMAMESLKK